MNKNGGTITQKKSMIILYFSYSYTINKKTEQNQKNYANEVFPKITMLNMRFP